MISIFKIIVGKLLNLNNLKNINNLAQISSTSPHVIILHGAEVNISPALDSEVHSFMPKLLMPNIDGPTNSTAPNVNYIGDHVTHIFRAGLPKSGHPGYCAYTPFSLLKLVVLCLHIPMS